jgi:hypothetical protein
MTTLPEKFVAFVILALFNAAIFAISYGSFATASFILYGNAMLLPIATTLVTAFISFVGVLTYTLWIKHAQNAMVWLLYATGNDSMAEVLEECDGDQE